MSTPSNPRPLARPMCPHLQSSTSTNSSSYSSTTSLTSPSLSSAPLPSPSHTHPHHQGFFGSLNHHQQQQQAQQSPPIPQQQQHVQQQQNPFQYQPNRDGAGRTASETNQFLNHQALLAEAAKRAQMAVVMRDIEGMEL